MAGETDIIGALLGSLTNTGNQGSNPLSGLLGGSGGFDLSKIVSQLFPGLMDILNGIAVIAFIIWGMYLGKRVISGYKGHKNFIITAFGTAGFGALCIVLGILFGDGIASSLGLDITSPLITSIAEYLGALMVSGILYIILAVMFKGPEYVSAKDLQQLVDVVNSLKAEVYEIKAALKRKGILITEKKKTTAKASFMDKLKGFLNVRTIIGVVMIVIFAVFSLNFAKNPVAVERVNSLFTLNMLGQITSSGSGNATSGGCLTVTQLMSNIMLKGVQPSMNVPSGFLNKSYYLVPSKTLSDQRITRTLYMNSTAGIFTVDNVDYYVVDVNNSKYWCLFLRGESFCECNPSQI